LIDGGTVGVGAINSAVLGNLTIGSAHIDCGPIGSNTCLRSSSVTFDNGSFSAITGAGKLLDVDTVQFSELSELYVIYTWQSERESFRGLTLIPIESLRLDCNLTYELTVSGADSTNHDFDRTVTFNSIIGRGFSISVPSIGNYSLKYKSNSSDASSYGYLTHDGFTSFSAFDQDDTFYDDVVVISAASRCYPLPTDSFTHSSTFSSQFESDSLSTWNLYTDESRGPDPRWNEEKNGDLILGVSLIGVVVAIFAGIVVWVYRHFCDCNSDDVSEGGDEVTGRPHYDPDMVVVYPVDRALIEAEEAEEQEASRQQVKGQLDDIQPTAKAYSLSELSSPPEIIWM
jgi:hypothetical protein